MATQPVATEHTYAEGPDGVRRLVAAPGDVIPETTPFTGFVTVPDDTPVLAPIDGYDDLTEAEAVAALATLSPEDLAAVQAYERAHLARGTVATYGQTVGVTAVSAARKTVPATSVTGGYDGMQTDALQAAADERGLTVTGDQRRKRANLIKALNDHDAATDGQTPPLQTAGDTPGEDDKPADA